MKKLALGAAIGAALPYAVRRRKQLQQRLTALLKRGTRSASRARRRVTANAHAVTQKVQHRQETPKDYDDATLARKVETEIFRDADAPKGTVDVNVQNGVVQLRGEVERPELIEELVSRTRSVQGVRDVETLLHVPRTSAPMHQ